MSIAPTLVSDDDLLTAEEQAAEWKLAPGTLAVWRSTGRYALPFVKIGRAVRYRRGTSARWMENRIRGDRGAE